MYVYTFFGQYSYNVVVALSLCQERRSLRGRGLASVQEVTQPVLTAAALPFSWFSSQDVYLVLLLLLPRLALRLLAWSLDFTSMLSAPGQSWLAEVDFGPDIVGDGDCWVGALGQCWTPHDSSFRTLIKQYNWYITYITYFFLAERSF